MKKSTNSKIITPPIVEILHTNNEKGFKSLYLSVVEDCKKDAVLLQTRQSLMVLGNLKRSLGVFDKWLKVAVLGRLGAFG